MESDAIFGVIAAVFAGNVISVWFFYAVFWGEAQKRKGIEEHNLPGWFFLGGSVPPIFCAWLAYMALY